MGQREADEKLKKEVELNQREDIDGKLHIQNAFVVAGIIKEWAGPTKYRTVSLKESKVKNGYTILIGNLRSERKSYSYLFWILE